VGDRGLMGMLVGLNGGGENGVPESELSPSSPRAGIVRDSGGGGTSS
jgi:hypothetical protein